MTHSQPRQGNGRAVLLLIAGIPLTMILAASWLWYFVVEGELNLVSVLGTANHGELLDPPRQLVGLDFTDDVGAAFSWGDLEPRWTMLIVNPGPVCDVGCERRLYTTRQLHIALGREFNRVRRVLLTDVAAPDVSVILPASPTEGIPTDAPTDLPGFVAAAHAGLVILSTESDTFGDVAPDWGDGAHHWYLVDPAGWVMMRFDDGLSYKDVIKDMKFLLKNSGG